MFNVIYLVVPNFHGVCYIATPPNMATYLTLPLGRVTVNGLETFLSVCLCVLLRSTAKTGRSWTSTLACIQSSEVARTSTH